MRLSSSKISIICCSAILLSNCAKKAQIAPQIIKNIVVNLTGNPDSYNIIKKGDSVFAIPEKDDKLKYFSGTDASTIIQSAINALTLPGGGIGSGGGSLHINKGIYYLTKELVINGWEKTNNPFSQLKITGDGYSTQLIQNTSGENAIVVKNAANICLRDFRVYTGTNAKSGLLADDNGLDYELSCHKSIIDNISFDSNSISSPAVYLKNFFDLSVSSMHAYNTENNGIVLENTSSTTNYGNSHFGFIRTIGSVKPQFAGLLIRTTNASKFMNLLTFTNYECAQAYYGIYSDCLKYSSFNFIDIEGIEMPIFLTGSVKGNETTSNVFRGGYLLPLRTGTAITNTLYTGANTFNDIFIEGEKTVIPILDNSQWRATNCYNLLFGGVDESLVSIKSPQTSLFIRKLDGTVIKKP